MADKKFALGDYVEVKDRIAMFYEAHPEGRLVTTDVRATTEPDDVPRVWVEAAAYRTPDDPQPGKGWSWMVLPGSTPYTRGSELENTETSAWGRAIGALGIGINGGIASAQEVRNKAGEDKREPEPETTTHDGGLIGVAESGKGDANFDLKQDRQHGYRLAFRLVQGRKGLKVMTFGPLAEAIATIRSEVEGQRLTVWGTMHDETFTPKGTDREVTYQVVHAERIATPDFILPAPEQEPVEAESVPLFDQPLTEDERQLIAGGLK